jgi:hypothetical protein
MPEIELTKAVDEWKRVKPMTLTQTGISDQLRKLQNYRRPEQAEGIATAKRVLNDVLAYVQQERRNKHVEKHEKAARWLDDLADALARENSALNILDGRVRAVAERQRKEEEARRKLEELRQSWLGKLQSLKLFFEQAERAAVDLEQRARQHASRASSGAFSMQAQGDLENELTKLQTERKKTKSRANWDALPQQLRETKIEELTRLFDAIAKIDERIRENSNGLEKSIRTLLESAAKASGVRNARLDTNTIRILEEALGLRYPQIDRDSAFKAWRNWALKNHPDKIVSPDKKESTARFQEVSDAFDKLKKALDEE